MEQQQQTTTTTTKSKLHTRTHFFFFFLPSQFNTTFHLSLFSDIERVGSHTLHLVNRIVSELYYSYSKEAIASHLRKKPLDPDPFSFHFLIIEQPFFFIQLVFNNSR